MPKPTPKPEDSPAVVECTRIFRSHLHMPDCSPVFAALASVVANYMQGDPVWLMLVGAPSTGKTVIVRACSSIPACRNVGEATSAASWLTWDKERGLGGILSPPRMEHGEQTGGIGDFGVLLYPEFTTVLSAAPDTRIFINSVHRRIYDGDGWEREYGTGGGRTLRWVGKAGALGAVTQAIDRHTLSAELGERWTYFRLPEPDLISQANAALANHAEDRIDKNARLAAAINDVFHASGIERGLTPRLLHERERIRMARTVAAACMLRGATARDSYQRDMIDLPQTEGPGRILAALTSMYLALELIGLRNAWCWKIVRKIAFDCAPRLRTRVVRHALQLQHARQPITTHTLYQMLPMSHSVLGRVLEDLKMLGILTHDGDGSSAGDGDGRGWRIEDRVAKLVRDMEDDL